MTSHARWALVAGGFLLALATALGALGSHALREHLAPDRLVVYETAVRYQFWHALGLLAIGLTARHVDSILLSWAAGLVLAGIVLFSGTIYAMTFGAPRFLGAITPAGGMSLIVGWLVFAVAVWRS